MNYRVTHISTYTYSHPVSLCHNLAHLTPRSTPSQTCLHSHLRIEPSPAGLTPCTDFFGNLATFFAVQTPHSRLTVSAHHTTEVTGFPRVNVSLSLPWEEVRELLKVVREPETLEAYHFVFDSLYIKANADLADYAAPSFSPGRPLLEAVLDLTARIHNDFCYDPSATTVATPLSEVLAFRRGVCQDFAHLEIGCLRSLGLAARYVSGYLLTSPPPGQQRLVGADASHAWLSVYCPYSGWQDIDPTNNQRPSDKHIVLAWGRDYADVSPIKGVILGGGDHTVTIGVDVSQSNGNGEAEQSAQ